MSVRSSEFPISFPTRFETVELSATASDRDSSDIDFESVTLSSTADDTDESQSRLGLGFTDLSTVETYSSPFPTTFPWQLGGTKAFTIDSDSASANVTRTRDLTTVEVYDSPFPITFDWTLGGVRTFTVDSDTSTASAYRERSLSGIAVDVGVSTGELYTETLLEIEATDRDESDTELVALVEPIYGKSRADGEISIYERADGEKSIIELADGLID